METREPAWSDFEGVYALRTHRYEEIETDPAYGMGTVDRPPTRGDFAVWFGHLQQSLLDGTGVCVVAEESGRIVGFAWIRRKDEARETRHLGDLTIEVLPGFRGRGIGSALLEHALRRCPGRLIVQRTEPGSPIGWRCSVCGDEGVISNWEESPFDLRRRQRLGHQHVIPDGDHVGADPAQ